MKSKSARILHLSSGLMVVLAAHGLSACGDVDNIGGDGDGDGDSSSGGSQSTGGAKASGGGPSSGGSPSAAGGTFTVGSGGAATGGENQGGQGGMGGAPDMMGGANNGGTGELNCPNELPAGDCELGDSFSCQGWVYRFVTPLCNCVETDGYDEPQWYCEL